ncbi:hypothetical protein AB9U01_25145 [Pseudomonas qingdaonensis]|uniref:hypothetical protein n=1 Tax=Pseudomonas qingdaonensis TaxID=2056231 RepID=UPI0035166221
MSTTPERRADALAELRAALDSVRLADRHEERRQALGKVQGMLFFLWRFEWIDRETFDALQIEIQRADGEGIRRCETKRG